MATTRPNDIVYGIHTVEMFLAEQATDIIRIYLQKGFNPKRNKRLLRSLRDTGVPISEVPKAKLDQLSAGGNHQGVVLQIAAQSYASLDDCLALAKKRAEKPFLLICDGIEDPHNLGSLLRTGDACGVHGIIIQERRQVGLTATVAKTSTGAIAHVPVVRVTNISQTIRQLKEAGLWIFGTDMQGDKLWDLEADLPLGLVIGNEHKGISPGVAKNLDGTYAIPMRGHVESLNASVAGALVMYEVYRKRHL